MENEKKKKIMLAIVGILVLVVGIVGLTYAYFIAQGQSEDIVVTSKNLKLVFDDSTPVINATDIEPIEEDEILTRATKKTFRISKESSAGKDLYVRLDMTDLVVSDNFKDFDLKWALYQGEEKITTGTFVPTLDGSTSINMTTNILINSTTPIEYNLYIWINETGLDQERLMDGTLSGKITAIGEVKPLNTLASNILKENIKSDNSTLEFAPIIEENQSVNLTSSSDKVVATNYTFNKETGYYTLSGEIVENTSYGSNYINYYSCNNTNTTCKIMRKIKAVNGTSVTQIDKYSQGKITNDKGLYVQKDDNEKSEFGFPTYYYRGSIENNYVSLGTYKNDIENEVKVIIQEGEEEYIDREEKTVAYTNDPIIWRIIRINEDGSIKLIMENNINKRQMFNDKTMENLYGIISRYVEENGKKSNVKTAVDDFYTSTITEKEIDNKIQIGSFCNDISGMDGTSSTTANSKSGVRFSSNSPIFKCPNSAIIVNEKSGMITSDELMFAGGIYNQKINNNVTYLNNNTDFWTISPFASDKNIYWDIERYMTHSFSYLSYSSARPVINLKSDIVVIDGDGSKSNPYTINTK